MGMVIKYLEQTESWHSERINKTIFLPRHPAQNFILKGMSPMKGWYIAMALLLVFTCFTGTACAGETSNPTAAKTKPTTSTTAEPERPGSPFGRAKRSGKPVENTDSLIFADLFYEDINVMDYVNERITTDFANVDKDEKKQEFTGYTAFPSKFKLYGNIVVIDLENDDPFFKRNTISFRLSPQVSPYGENFADITWMDTKYKYSYDRSDVMQNIIEHSTLKYPVIRLNNGATPDLDATINAEIEKMLPALKKAGLSSLSDVNFKENYISIVYYERSVKFGDGGNRYSAAVPGAALMMDLTTEEKADIQKVIKSREWEYAFLSGNMDEYFIVNDEWDALKDFPNQYNYITPKGSVYRDVFIAQSGFVLTLIQPDGKRILMREKWDERTR